MSNKPKPMDIVELKAKCIWVIDQVINGMYHHALTLHRHDWKSYKDRANYAIRGVREKARDRCYEALNERSLLLAPIKHPELPEVNEFIDSHVELGISTIEQVHKTTIA